jgi:hypothetical protein
MVSMAWIYTGVVVLSLTLYACTTKTDIIMKGRNEHIKIASRHDLHSSSITHHLCLYEHFLVLNHPLHHYLLHCHHFLRVLPNMGNANDHRRKSSLAQKSIFFSLFNYPSTITFLDLYYSTEPSFSSSSGYSKSSCLPEEGGE